MRSSRIFLAATLAVALGLLAACVVGNNPARSPVATSPRGVELSIRRAGFDAIGAGGELLAVSDSGLYLLMANDIVLYHFRTPMEVRSAVTGARWIAPDESGSLGRLAQYARYPGGLAEPVLAQLLSVHERDSVIVRRP